jgi:hypothetical protein
MQDYAEYKQEFMRDWTRKVSRAAGVAEGRGKRGALLMDDLFRKLNPGATADELHAFRTRWMRWKSGQQTPSHESFKSIHARALKLGYLGQPTTLRAMKERAGMMGEVEWEFWRRYEANPAFDVEAREQELRERLVALEQEAAAIRRALASNESAHTNA